MSKFSQISNDQLQNLVEAMEEEKKLQSEGPSVSSGPNASDISQQLLAVLSQGVLKPVGPEKSKAKNLTGLADEITMIHHPLVDSLNTDLFKGKTEEEGIEALARHLGSPVLRSTSGYIHFIKDWINDRKKEEYRLKASLNGNIVNVPGEVLALEKGVDDLGKMRGQKRADQKVLLLNKVESLLSAGFINQITANRIIQMYHLDTSAVPTLDTLRKKSQKAYNKKLSSDIQKYTEGSKKAKEEFEKSKKNPDHPWNKGLPVYTPTDPTYKSVSPKADESLFKKVRRSSRKK